MQEEIENASQVHFTFVVSAAYPLQVIFRLSSHLLRRHEASQANE